MFTYEKSRKIGVFRGPISFVVLPFQSGLQYRNSDFKRFNRMNFSALCTILVTFGLVTPEFTLLTTTPFAAIRQNRHITPYVRISGTYLDVLYRFGRSMGGDNYPDIRLAFAQGTLLRQPVKFGRCLQMSCGRTFTLCSGVRLRIGQLSSRFQKVQ